MIKKNREKNNRDKQTRNKNKERVKKMVNMNKKFLIKLNKLKILQCYQIQVIKYLMGKTKTKYPVEITLQFIHLIINQSYHQKIVPLKMNKSPLTFADIEQLYEQFLEQGKIIRPALLQLCYQNGQEDINQSFQIEIPKILDQFGGILTFIVQSEIYLIIDQITQNIRTIHSEIQLIKERLNQIPTKEDMVLLYKNPIPQLTKNQSTINPNSTILQNLDLGVLFSEPIFDQIRKKPAANPVDFRSEIQRLHTALKSSMKADINFKCEIATKQNLKHLIKFSGPKILHIICHGTSQGALQFEDDSRTVLGTLQTVKTDQIIQTLKSCADILPQVVFINSCYSERVGQAFFKMGVNYVIAIDSQDTIQDEAAQIFSEHFYRNIFSGQKVRQAFNSAKQRVKLKHNSFGCCCRHSSKQKHKPNCRWLEMIRRPNSQLIDDQQQLQKHKLFHVPSDLCKCQLKNLNRHKLICQWARQALFHINNDFRILDGDTYRFPKYKSEYPSYIKDQLVICCCFNYESGNQQVVQFRVPHSQSNKFKIFQNTQKIKNQIVFDISLCTGRQNQKQINDLTPSQLLETHQRIQSSIMGRQKQIYQFMKKIKDLNQIIYLVYGPVGVGRTSFVLKCVTYLIQRRVFQLYFYIDLYGIRDKDIFRYKFNQITKFNYDGQIKQQKVKNKMMIIILDNADDFYQLEREQLYQQLKFLRQQLHKSKVIVTLKQQNCSTFDFQKVHSQKYGLEPLSIPAATKLIFLKMRHLFDLSVQYNQIDSLVRSNQSLRIPKFIQSLCQSFSTAKNKKIKVAQIKKKLQIILEGDGAGNKLIQQNIRALKQKSDASYNLLLFMSQFSQGISLEDFKMLAIYQNKDSLVHLPVGKNWQAVLATLFEKHDEETLDRESCETDSNFTEESDFSNPSLKNIQSNNSFKENFIQKEKQSKKIVKGESYFLDEVSQNKYIVKRFIRQFIWKKHESPQNYYMKYLFVGYLSVMLQFYFKWLIESKYIHEDLLQYSYVTESGVFSYKDNVFNAPMNLSASIQLVKQHKSQFEKIIIDHKSVLQRIRKSDPSIFIANHKQDFLNIYEKRWDIVFKYLKQLKHNNEDKKRIYEDKICISYLQNLIIQIPTAFKIAKVENTLLKYIISKSMSLLYRLQKYSQQQGYVESHKILAIQLKLNLMRLSIDIQKVDIDYLKSELELSKQSIKLIKNIKDASILQYAKKYWNYQKIYILMYKEYLSRKDPQSKSFIDKNKAPFQKIKGMIETLINWLAENWDQAQQLLIAKKNLIIGLFYLNIIKYNSVGHNPHTSSLRLKRQHENDIIEKLSYSAMVFNDRNLMKLCLRAKLTMIQIFVCQVSNPKKRIKAQSNSTSDKYYQQLIVAQQKVLQCEKMYAQRKNNLIVFMQFQNEIKSLKNTLKQKFWAFSSDTLVCMRPVPLIINGDTPIIQNLVRKKNKFRKQIQKVVNPNIDLCAKFQILTKKKLKQQVQNGCTMLLLTANVKIYNKIPYLIFQGVRMQEDLVQINQNFTQQYDLSKIKILMIVGNNSYQAIKQLQRILPDPPIMISLGNQTASLSLQQLKRQTIQYKRPQDLQIFTFQQKRKTQIQFLKHFIKILMDRQISAKQQIYKICKECQPIVKNKLNLQVLYRKRVSPLQIKHKQGTYKDLSPGYQKNHNIDMKIKSFDNTTNFICIRRWKDTYRVFQHIRKRAEQSKSQNNQKFQNSAVYINVFGEIGSGKSTFIHQIARLFVQRERYSAGVYIIDGKLLQKKYQGEFENYFNKQSEIGKIMTLQEFEKNGNQNLMLIIDDFHLIRPRSNGRFNLFLQKIVEKRVNLIIVTNTTYLDLQKQNKKDSQFIFKTIKLIKIDKLCLLQIDLIASNILDLKNPALLQKYQELKAKNYEQIRVQDIYQLKANFYSRRKHHQFSIEDSKQMKKMQSLKQG